MNKSTKKRLLLLILIMIPILALYGCGGNDDEEPMTESPGENEEEVVDGEEESAEEDVSDPEESTEDEEDSEEESWEARDPESIFTEMEFPDNFSYNMTMESEESGSYTVTYRMLGEKYRTEGEWEGQRVITIQDDEYYYFLDPEAMTAMRFPIDQAEAMEEESGEEAQFEEFSIEEDWERLEIIGEETINGEETYIVLDQEADVEIRMWIHKEYGIPMRIESSGPNPEDDYVMEVTNLEVGEVSEEDFEVPDDYEIMDFDN